MASSRSRFDFSPATRETSLYDSYDDGYSSDGLGPSWLTTAYPRALCSIYPMGDVDCWDLLLTSSQPCDISHLDYTTNRPSTPLQGSSSRRFDGIDSNDRTGAEVAARQEQAIAMDQDLGSSKARRQDRGQVEGSRRGVVLLREPFEQTSQTRVESFPRSTPKDAPKSKATQSTWYPHQRQLKQADIQQDDSNKLLRDNEEIDDQVDEVTRDLAELEAVSPGAGLLSQALCNIGFDCIDYFTMTRDTDDDDDIKRALPPSSLSSSSSSLSRRTRSVSHTAAETDPALETRRPKSTRAKSEGHHCNTFERLGEADSPVLKTLSASRSMPVPTPTSELNLDLDISSGWAAAVCGKRMAALERKRVLSRSSGSHDYWTASSLSMPSVEDASNVEGSDLASPWFETWDRLSRWEEVAYR